MPVTNGGPAGRLSSCRSTHIANIKSKRLVRIISHCSFERPVRSRLDFVILVHELHIPYIPLARQFRPLAELLIPRRPLVLIVACKHAL